jgi:lipoprotein-releasing system permease protein
MNPFLRYFVKFVLHAKTKQPLLFLATLGLVISSFALLVLQGTMGGLQSKMIERSKSINGQAIISFANTDSSELGELYKYLDVNNIKHHSELVLELLIRAGDNYAPIIAHGVEPEAILPFISPSELITNGMFLGSDLANKIGAGPEDKISLISPAHVDPFLGNIPKMATIIIKDSVQTNVPEVDSVKGWVPIIRLQALIGQSTINTVRLLSHYNEDDLTFFLKKHYENKLKLSSWERANATLVWALNLETTMMVFLFTCMCLLVSLSITSGLMLFFDKIKRDLVSFWILGKDEESIYKSLSQFLMMISTVSVFVGLVLGTFSLYVIDYYGPNIMPAIFVDQKIPVHYNLKMFLISGFIPFIISIVFSKFALSSFKKDVRYLDYVSSL